MKSAVIYERKGKFYIRASSQTNVGVWVDDGECYSVDVDSDHEEIGKCVFTALNKSKTNIIHPTDWKGVSIPLFEAAKVKSWSTFGKNAKCVNIYVDNNDIKIMPTENKSSINEGFLEKEKSVILITTKTNNAELGKNIKKAWSLCE